MKSAIPEAVLKHHTAVLGKTGSGKTSTAKLIVEQAVDAGARVCVLDPVKSDWWGLTSSADGRKPGLPFQILGGPHGHVPLHDGAGAAIGELVATGALPLSIIDMADFKAGGPNRFFNAFADMLMRKMKGVLYLVVEEAHEFAPKERSGVGDENMAIYYAKKLATAGRSKGIRLVVCSQAVQQLHNRVLGSCETLIVHRFTAPADQAPVLAWLKSNVESKIEQQEISRSLRGLKTGEAWICASDAPLERKQFPRIHTFDNSATPEDDSHRASVVTAKVDVEQLRELVGVAVDEAATNDPVALKKRISELDAQIAVLKNAPRGASDEQLHAARADGRADGIGSAFRAVQEVHWKMRDELLDAISSTYKKFEISPESLNTPPSPVARPAVTGNAAVMHAAVTARGRPVQRPAPVTGAAGRIAGGAPRNLLIALAQNPEGLRPRKLAILAEVQEGGSTWRGAFAKFRRESLVVETDLVRITAEGLDALGSYEPLPTGPALRNQWRQKIGGGPTRLAIFDEILDAWPNAIAAAEVARRTGVEPGGSTWRGHMAHLRGLEIVHGSAELRASEDLFE